MTVIPTAYPPSYPATADTILADPHRQAAEDLASSFIAEMLKSAKLGDAWGSEQSGAMSDAFTSTILAEVARDMSQMAGPLVEQIYTSLARSEGT